MHQESFINIDATQLSEAKKAILLVDFSLADVQHMHIEDGNLIIIKHDGSRTTIEGFFEAADAGILDFLVTQDQLQMQVVDLINALGPPENLVDGDILESLEAKLNNIATSAS